MTAGSAPVTVIIAAYRAADTIGAAVRSALAERPVGEVIVVDDASPDDTAEAAGRADDGSGRLRVLRQAANAGPSAARNRALDEATLPLAAILDADDHILPGRFEPLLARDDWDFIADNIVFVPEGDGAALPPADLPRGDSVRTLGLEEFVRRNISRRGRQRAELGFLKPVFQREFLLAHSLRYAEPVRLGEDFLLYAEAMARGARFLIAQRCGYLAVERAASLSGRHSTSDLRALESESRKLAAHVPTGSDAATALAAHARALQLKVRHRQLLDDKATMGPVRALGRLARHPRDMLPVARAIFDDKTGSPPARPALRLLFDREEFVSAHTVGQGL